MSDSDLERAADAAIAQAFPAGTSCLLGAAHVHPCTRVLG